MLPRTIAPITRLSLVNPQPFWQSSFINPRRPLSKMSNNNNNDDNLAMYTAISTTTVIWWWWRPKRNEDD